MATTGARSSRHGSVVLPVLPVLPVLVGSGAGSSATGAGSVVVVVGAAVVLVVAGAAVVLVVAGGAVVLVVGARVVLVVEDVVEVTGTGSCDPSAGPSGAGVAPGSWTTATGTGGAVVTGASSAPAGVTGPCWVRYAVANAATAPRFKMATTVTAERRMSVRLRRAGTSATLPHSVRIATCDDP